MSVLCLTPPGNALHGNFHCKGESSKARVLYLNGWEEIFAIHLIYGQYQVYQGTIQGGLRGPSCSLIWVPNCPHISPNTVPMSTKSQGELDSGSHSSVESLSRFGV